MKINFAPWSGKNSIFPQRVGKTPISAQGLVKTPRRAGCSHKVATPVKPFSFDRNKVVHLYLLLPNRFSGITSFYYFDASTSPKRDCEEPRSRHGIALGFIRSWRRQLVYLYLAPGTTTLFALVHSRHIIDVGEPPMSDRVVAWSPSTDEQTVCLVAADA